MKALLAAENDALRVEEIPVPQPLAGEVLIRVHAAAVNRADLLQRRGKYDPPPGASKTMGLECAGEVAALGPGASRFKIGDKIMALMAGGGQAEFATAHESHCLPVPSTFSWHEAGASMEALATVYANLFMAAHIKQGETALIHGGSSGIGTFAIQMLKACGIKSIATVSSPEKAKACLELGAMHAINYKEQDFVEAVADITDDAGVDVVLDMVGGSYVNRNLHILAKYGRHVSIATQQGAKAEINLRLVMGMQLILTGSTLRSRSTEDKAGVIQAMAAAMTPHLTAGAVKPLLFQAFPLEKAGEAHKVMESSAHIGKIVLTV